MPTIGKNSLNTGKTQRGYASGGYTSDQFYRQKAWRKLREYVLSSNPLCVSCEKNGRIVEAKVVDHIQPINQGGAKLDPNNLQPLCERCHNTKSAKESHQNK